MGMVPDKVAIVTGAGAGVGRATALKFAAEGAKVAVSDVNVEGGEETVDLIRKQGGDAFFTAADVARPADVEVLVAKTVGRFGRLDCACNNAGIEGKIVPFTEQPLDNFDRVIAVNLRGVFLCLQAEISQMLKNGGGAIVNLASVAGLIGFPGLAPMLPPSTASTA